MDRMSRQIVVLRPNAVRHLLAVASASTAIWALLIAALRTML